jgi:hypothetical protein
MQKCLGATIMKIWEIRKIAVTWGVDAGIGRFKKDIIRDIQIREGYSPWYAPKEACEQDCLKEVGARFFYSKYPKKMNL